MTVRVSEGGPAQLVLAASVARRYYVDGRSKVDIADEMGLSRFKVARLLDFARTSGLVKIEIGHAGAVDVELSNRLQDAYGLAHALVIETDDSHDENVRDELGKAAAELFGEIVGPDDVLGLAWARAVRSMTGHLTQLANVPVVQLTGVLSQPGVDENSVGLVREAARITGGDAYVFYAPLVVPDNATARALRRQPEVARAFGQFSTVTKAVVGLGLWEAGQSTLFDALEPKAREQVRRSGAVADVSGIMVDAAGRPVEGRVADRMLTITADQMRAIPEVIAIAYGTAKAPAVRAAILGGFVNGLVTPTALAHALLDLDA